ncbi:Nmad5 family putative nucleotide modification protein [Magnetospirillum molischianum]|uniref:Nucleotide modification associated domain-containing protein n=1 Tax=Magnetospirillum molischianum DSM 120 TaxID=1150626 RepID=H8FYC4_MAGML|nr:Nmad5 family putative nucleotide modification protein [Magnetospirillum molischianum]CCG43362.1 conserved hypothetical protein [Magnetospirillum molischianum DSM 120]
MNKLTNFDRDQIVGAVLKDAFDARNQAHQDEGYALGMSIYADVFGEKMIGQMNALPDGWLPTIKVVKVMIAGAWTELVLSDFVRVLASRNGHCLKSYEATDPLAERFTAWANAGEEIRVQKSELRNKVRALVYSVTTVKKLIEVWPEAVNYLPKKTVPVKLPAVCGSDLNSLIADLKEAA